MMISNNELTLFMLNLDAVETGFVFVASALL